MRLRTKLDQIMIVLVKSVQEIVSRTTLCVLRIKWIYFLRISTTKLVLGTSIALWFLIVAVSTN